MVLKGMPSKERNIGECQSGKGALFWAVYFWMVGCRDTHLSPNYTLTFPERLFANYYFHDVNYVK